MWTRLLLRRVCTLFLTVLLGGLLGATLVRIAPGFGVDQQELDSRLNSESIQAIRHSRAQERGIFPFYVHSLARMLHGDLGTSHTFGRPVRELLVERIPLTLRSMAFGLIGGWFFGFVLALPGSLSRWWPYDLFTTVGSSLLLCLPTAALALFFLYFNGPVSFAIGLVVLPQVFRYSRNLITQKYSSPHVLSAKARGLSEARIFVWHVLPLAATPLLALIGVSVSIAFGATIPIEVICDSPGIGQLAWQAALGRDLPVLVNLTLLVTAITLIANTISDLTGQALAKHQA